MASDVKWIKITTDMFDNRKIRHLRRLPEGNNIVLIWVMLLTMAGRCNSNGMVFLTENIPYTPKMLADELDFEENTVQLALNALEQLNMIVTNSGYFTIAGWDEYQNIEGMDKIREQNRLRKQKQRAREKKMLIGSSCVCAYCGDYGDTVDHVVAKTKGGLDIPENTVCCCSSCNLEKNNHDVVKFLNDRLLKKEKVDIAAINKNEVLQKYVHFDFEQQKFVTGHVTGSHATDIDKERDTDRERENKSNNGRSRFTPPSLDEVKDYCKERGNKVDAERWFDYYTSNGWKVGKNTMKDWKAAVRTWERSGNRSGNNETTGDTGQSGKYGVWL